MHRQPKSDDWPRPPLPSLSMPRRHGAHPRDRDRLPSAAQRAMMCVCACHRARRSARLFADQLPEAACAAAGARHVGSAAGEPVPLEVRSLSDKDARVAVPLFVGFERADPDVPCHHAITRSSRSRKSTRARSSPRPCATRAPAARRTPTCSATRASSSASSSRSVRHDVSRQD